MDMEQKEGREIIPIEAISDDFLIQVAEHAERRIDAVIKIKKVALKVTNPRDWTNQNGNPYLQVSGSEKIANLFNISWRIDEPIYDEESDGHFTWTYKGYFSLGGRTTEVIGTRSSKDAFFNKYEYKEEESGKKTKTLLPISAIDKGDVKKAALTNLLGNGITRILGIRNLTWQDLKEFAGITQEQVMEIQYKKHAEPIQEPQKKNGNAPKGETQKVVTSILNVAEKEGKKTDGSPYIRYTLTCEIEGKQMGFATFSKTIGDKAKKAKGTPELFEIEFIATKFGNEIVNMAEPGDENAE